MKSDADKALALVGRYARLQVRMHQCRQTAGRLLDQCESPAHHLDEHVGSGCMAKLRAAKSNGAITYGPDGESNWHQVLHGLDFCRPCALGLVVWAHGKRRLGKRRASVLGSMKRLGTRAQRPDHTQPDN
jgi:hypothetical protein